MTFSISRQQIIEAARSLEGVPFVHQGRDKDTGVDCIGLCVVVAESVGYGEIIDMRDYKRTPSASDLYELLKLNCDEIEVSDAQIGDIYLAKMGGAKPRHVMIKTSDTHIIHALNTISINRVVEQSVDQYRRGIVRAFQLRGVI